MAQCAVAEAPSPTGANGTPAPPTTAPRDFGVVFDIDGVLCRGETLIPGAVDAVKKVSRVVCGVGKQMKKRGDGGAQLRFVLPDANTLPFIPPQLLTASVPFCFVTNQGWLSESDRAALLSRQLGLAVPPDACVLAHSALTEDAGEINPGLVLVSGRCRTNAADIVRGYGYVNVRTIEEYSAALPHLNPLKHAGVGASAPPSDGDDDASLAWARQPVAAIFLVETPADWHDDLQVMVDVLRSADGVPGSCVEKVAPAAATTSTTTTIHQTVKLYCCNFDFFFAAEHPLPRFGPGAFLTALRALYAAATGGRDLHVIAHGKPHRPAYVVAEHKLARRAAALMSSSSSPPPFKHIYAIGDNPASDVRGANAAGGPWRSVLVRSGVWNGEGKENDDGDPAHFVCEDVGEAVALVLEANGL